MTILASLNNYYDRLAKTVKVPPYGYSNERISFAIELSIAGEIVAINDLRSMEKNKHFPRILSVPAYLKRRTSGIRSNFLWDKTSYVLGVTKSNQPTQREHDAFKQLHEQHLNGIDNPGLQALLLFLRQWEPAEYKNLHYASEMMDTNVVFRLDGEHRYLHDCDAARAAWGKHIDDISSTAQRDQCLVTGKHTPIASSHPAIKGVYGAQSSGGSIVSFNLDAFCSYGKKKGEGRNAPVSEVAAFGYTAALNKLLERGSRNRLQIADASTVFWADTTDVGEAAATAGEDLFATVLKLPTDEQEAAKIRDPLEMIAKGKPLKEINPQLNEKTRFHVLGLAPNASRLSIRFWQSDRLDNFIKYFRRHWKDLDIEPCPWRTVPSVYNLALQTSRCEKDPKTGKFKFDNEKTISNLAGELMRAVLTGRRYPRSLLTAVIVRIRADREVNGMRAAIIKACLTRDRRENRNSSKNHKLEKIPVSLDKDDPNPAYRLGRLFAVLENAQRSALGEINATIRDRYYAAASATPRVIFPTLIRNAGHHISKLRKGDKGGLAYWFDGQIGEVMNGLGSEMPLYLRIEEQGRFAIGYYHQRYTKKGDSDTTTDATAAEDQDQ